MITHLEEELLRKLTALEGENTALRAELQAERETRTKSESLRVFELPSLRIGEQGYVGDYTFMAIAPTQEAAEAVLRGQHLQVDIENADDWEDCGEASHYWCLTAEDRSGDKHRNRSLRQRADAMQAAYERLYVAILSAGVAYADPTATNVRAEAAEAKLVDSQAKIELLRQDYEAIVYYHQGKTA